VKLLVVAPQPFFSPRGTPFSVYYRTQVACGLHQDVDLLTYGQGEDVDLPRCRIVRIPAFRWLGPVPIGPSFYKLFLDCFMVAWTVGLLMWHRYDVVHAHEEAVFWCRWLKPVFRFRLIYDMHSSLPQQLHNFEFTALRTVHWLFETLERSAVRAADAVVVICPALRDYARTLTHDDDKIILIENTLFDPVRFAAGDPGAETRAQDAEIERARGLDQWLSTRRGDRVVVYAGTLEAYQGIDKLLEAFALVVPRMSDAGLLIIGGSPPEVERFRRMADDFDLGPAVHFTGQVPQPEAQRLVTLAGACVSPRFAGNNTPLKIYQLMADGIPLIATRIESHTQVLNDEISILSDISTGALAEAMIQTLSDPDGARSRARRAQEWYQENYSRDAYTAKMRKLLSMVA